MLYIGVCGKVKHTPQRHSVRGSMRSKNSRLLFLLLMAYLVSWITVTVVLETLLFQALSDAQRGKAGASIDAPMPLPGPAESMAPTE